MVVKKGPVRKKTTKKSTTGAAAVAEKPKKKGTKEAASKVVGKMKKLKVTAQSKPKLQAKRKRVVVDLAIQLVQSLHDAQHAPKKKLQAFLSTRDEYGYTPLMYAALFNDQDSLKKIMKMSHTVFHDKKAWVEQCINVHDAVRGWAALHCAVIRGHGGIVQDLVKAIVATCKGDEDLVYRALVPQETRHQWTPIMFAVNNADYAMTDLLLSLYKKYLTAEQFSNVLLHKDERGEKVYSYTTREDIHTLLTQYGVRG